MTDITISTVYSSRTRLADSIYWPNITRCILRCSTRVATIHSRSHPHDERNLALKALREVQKHTGCKAGAAIHHETRTRGGRSWRW